VDDEPAVLKFGGGEFFLEGGKTSVGVVLVHEIFGFNDYIKSVAKEFSRNGYWVAAVDIFRGTKPQTVEEGRKVKESLTNTEVLDALGNGLKLLKERISGKARVGTNGFLHGRRLRVTGRMQLGIRLLHQLLRHRSED
jgi:dienelactone hydrolase